MSFYLFIMLYQNFNDDILKLNVHHSSHSFFLGSHQSRSKDNTKVGYSHQILLTVQRYPLNEHKQYAIKWLC